MLFHNKIRGDPVIVWFKFLYLISIRNGDFMIDSK